jgi:hypothetical protein
LSRVLVIRDKCARVRRALLANHVNHNISRAVALNLIKHS